MLAEKKSIPRGEKETPPGEKVTIFINAFLALAAFGRSYLKKGTQRAIEAWDRRRRRRTIVATRGVGRGRVWAGAGWAGGAGFFGGGRGGGAGRPGGVGTWRYVSTTGIWTNPMRTVRSKKRVHGQKSWHKRDATWRKGDPTWRKSDNVGEKVDFIGAKKYIVL